MRTSRESFLVLVASLAGLLADARHPAQAAITVTIDAPVSGQLSGTPLLVKARVTSTYQVGAVVAQVGAAQGVLASSGAGAWQGSIPLGGASFGTQTLNVTATDVFGAAGSAQVPFKFDRTPVITVVSPGDGDIARPSIHLQATCSDDGPSGCVSFTAKASAAGGSAALLASGSTSIDAVVTLAALDGNLASLVFEAKDSAGQLTQITRSIYVEASPFLVSVAELPGTTGVLDSPYTGASIVIDVQPDRILYLGGNEANPRLLIRNVISSQDTQIGAAAYAIGFLVPTGVVFEPIPPAGGFGGFYEWNNGIVIELDGVGQIVARGRWAAYQGHTAGDAPIIVLRDLSLGVATSAIGPDLFFRSYLTGLEVADNGDVVFGLGPNGAGPTVVYRLRNGVFSLLASSSGYPLTDGNSVVHLSGGNKTAVYGPGGIDRALTGAMTPPPIPHADYDIADGYVAFTKTAGDSTRQVWLLPNGGTESQISFFGSSCSIKSLGTDGRVAISSGGRLYLTDSAGASPTDVGSALGDVYFRQGAFYLVIGRFVYRILDGPCSTSGSLLCVNSHRFGVTVNWRNYNDGSQGSGQAVGLTSDSGYFWFFNSSNIELVVKVLDGRSANGKFWVMYGALSDVEYTITVTDTITNQTRTYYNPPHVIASHADVNAF